MRDRGLQPAGIAAHAVPQRSGHPVLAERGQHLGIQPDGPAADPDSPALTGRDQAYTSWPDSILFGFGRTQ